VFTLYLIQTGIAIINDILQAITQNQLLGNSRFYAMVGLRREPKPRGRQKKQNEPEENLNQGELPF